MLASLNQGKSLKGTNSSSPPSNSQKPWGETLDTSTREVLLPSGADFTGMCLHQLLSHSDLLVRQAIIVRQSDGGLKPELSLAVGT